MWPWRIGWLPPTKFPRYDKIEGYFEVDLVNERAIPSVTAWANQSKIHRQDVATVEGARVVASVGGLRMERRIHTGSSYLSQSETVATFGLGAAARVDSLVVYWPSGQVDRFADVEGNQELRIEEGTGAL